MEAWNNSSILTGLALKSKKASYTFYHKNCLGISIKFLLRNYIIKHFLIFLDSVNRVSIGLKW